MRPNSPHGYYLLVGLASVLCRGDGLVAPRRPQIRVNRHSAGIVLKSTEESSFSGLVNKTADVEEANEVKGTLSDRESNGGFELGLADFYQGLLRRFVEIARLAVAWLIRKNERTKDWLLNDPSGSLVLSGVFSFAFLASVALFAVWTIEVLGGKKWSGPGDVPTPVIHIPQAKKVRFQAPVWKSPKII